MRILKLAFLAVSLLQISPGSAAEADWSQFRDPGGVFTVEFPQTPTVKQPDKPDQYPAVMYQFAQGPVAMLVQVSDFSSGNFEPTSLLDRAAKGASGGAKVDSDTVDTLDGNQGRKVSFTDSDGFRLTDRLFFVNGHLYQVITAVGSSATPQDESDAQRFLQSFHFVAQAPQTAAAGTPATHKEANWSQFHDPAGRFTVEFPEAPKIEHEDKSDKYQVDLGPTALLIQVRDFTGGNFEPVSLLDRAAKGAPGGAKVDSDTIDTLDGNQGRKVSFTDSDGFRLTDRLFFVNEHLYQVIIAVGSNATPEDDSGAQRFLQSFHFVASPPSAQEAIVDPGKPDNATTRSLLEESQ